MRIFSGKDEWNYSVKVKNFYGDETFFTILDETFFQADENLKMKMKAFKLFKCEMKIDENFSKCRWNFLFKCDELFLKD